MVFIARAVWNITKYFNVNELQDLMSDWLEDSPAYYYSSYLVRLPKDLLSRTEGPVPSKDLFIILTCLAYE